MMKSFFSLLLCTLSVFAVSAADLTASVTPAGTGKKDGKISLAVTGGFAPYTFSWTGPGGYSSSVMNPESLEPGTYCVTVTDKYCGTAELCVTVTGKATALKELATVAFNVYPNPFRNQLFIDLGSKVNGRVHVSLYDNTGKLVATQDAEARPGLLWELNTPLPAGIYLLRARLSDGTELQTRVSALGK
jgi:hypothetical protein